MTRVSRSVSLEPLLTTYASPEGSPAGLDVPKGARVRGQAFTAALIGPDGAGKTTIARKLERDFPARMKYLYMGVNRDASNRMLPTTRLIRAVKRALGAAPDTAGPPDSRRLAKPRPAGGRKRALAAARSAARVANQLAEEWYRELLAWSYVRRGWIVVFDRHFFSDFYAFDVADASGRPLSRRIHGFFLAHVYPKPDLVVYLDAPPAVLLARKGEGTIEALARRRGEYLALAEVTPHFAVVDASRPTEEVTAEVAALLSDFGVKRTSRRRQPREWA
jgi:thymidylate kinase